MSDCDILPIYDLGNLQAISSSSSGILWFSFIDETKKYWTNMEIQPWTKENQAPGLIDVSSPVGEGKQKFTKIII